MSSQTEQTAELELVVTNTLIVRDMQRSVAFYRDVLGAKVLRTGEPTFLGLGNIWLTINGGGGPTDDKPEVVFAPTRTECSEHLSEHLLRMPATGQTRPLAMAG
jgi:catechol 2,3-dioxygenase-like lactoylglutathione lyase family enzyme